MIRTLFATAALVALGVCLFGVNTEAVGFARSPDDPRGPQVRCMIQSAAQTADKGHHLLEVPAPTFLYSHGTQEVFMYVFMAHSDERIGGNAEATQRCWSPDEQEVVKFYFPVGATTFKTPIPRSMAEARVRLCARSPESVMCLDGSFPVKGVSYSSGESYHHSEGGDMDPYEEGLGHYSKSGVSPLTDDY